MRLVKVQYTASAYVTCVFGLPEPEVVQAHVELAPGMALGRHRHPGEEIVYVLEGSLEYQLEGQPPVTLKLPSDCGWRHRCRGWLRSDREDDLAGRVMLKSSGC